MTETPLDGRNALVTGGTRGIGRGIVLAYARAGASVTTCYGRDEAAADQLARELKEIGGDHHVERADVSRPEEVDRLVAECGERYGSIDVLVHNAGQISHVPIGELPREEWQRIIDINLTAAYQLVRAALPLLRSGSSVITIGSGSAMVGIPLRAHYTAAKAGLIGLTRSLAKELGPRGIRVNVLSPGVVETEAPIPEGVAEKYSKMIPLGRLGRPEEIAEAAVFLAGEASSFVNGATIGVDGGI